MPQAINNIDGSVVGYTPAPANFAGLVADTLGNAGDASDGFDAILNALVASIPATDRQVAQLDSSVADLAAAIDNFDSLDAGTWADGFPPPIMALATRPNPPAPLQPGGIQLPPLPPPPNGTPPGPPPQQCIPQPAPGPQPTPSPTPVPPVRPPVGVGNPPCPPGYFFNSFTAKCQPLCPTGYSYTGAGNCLPTPAQPPAIPPKPPVVLPPIPIGLPPCPQGFTSDPSGNCTPTGTSDTESKILMLLGQELLSLGSKEIVPVTAAWVGSFTGLSLATSALLVGAIIGVGALLISILGGGCGEACIDSSKIEQVYEAIGDDLYRTAKAGMIAGPAAVVAITHFMGVGDQALERLNTDQARAGQQNMDLVLTNLIAAARKLPAAATVPLNVATAEKLFVGGAGWYPDSIAIANQVTVKFLTAMQQSTSA